MGSALLDRPKRLKELLMGMAAASDIPITLKVRMGIDNNTPTIHKNLVPDVHNWGVSALTVHGRYRAQRYKSHAHWDYISQCSKLCQLPLVGNGDIYNHVQARDYLQNYGVDSLMLARGALIKPWLFKEIKENREWDISSSERFDLIKKYTDYGLEHWGTDSVGVENTRYFLLNWMSFLHRYIPVGLLERHPIGICDRPMPFVGRDDLETLFASRKVSDWIKISEMVLGPVKDKERFEHFKPKHEAAAWTANKEETIT